MLSLEEIYKDSLEREQVNLQRVITLDTPAIQKQGDQRELWYNNKTFALAAFFIEKDVAKAKQHFYACGLLSVYMQKTFSERLIDYGIDHATFVLLSDEKSIINDFSKLTHQWFDHTIKTGSLIFAIQCIIRENNDGLQKSIDVYEKIVATQKGKINIPDLLFFKGMLSKDETMMIEGITMLLKDHKKRNKHMGIAQEYISIPALTYTKLAWRQGFELDINHPFIPKALLPVQPLPDYKIPYEFLQDWVSNHPL